MEAELKNLRIDRTVRKPAASKWASRWIIGGVLLFVLLGAGRFVYEKVNAAPEVQILRVKAAGSPSASGGAVILNATGYIIAAHRIQVASKVVGKVSWIGVDKGSKVKEGQVIVRLEDDEYRAQLQQARGQLANLEAKLRELQNGSRPEEVAGAAAEITGASENTGAAGGASTAGASPDCGRKESTLSPGSPMTKRFVKTGTSAPSSKKISSRVPSTGEVTSKVALSVSISATSSPAETGSPLRFAHRATRTSSTVLPSFGASTGVAIYR